MDDSSWSVVVFRIASEQVQDILIDLFRFVEHLAGVQSLHFIIRDRVDDAVVVSFRILLDRNEKDCIESTITQQLRNGISELTFIINPDLDHPFHQYVALPWKERIENDGIEKFT